MNPMCESCTKYGINCDGTENMRFSGCIYKVDLSKYPRYVKRENHIGTFVELARGTGCKLPVYRFPGGVAVVSEKELELYGFSSK